MPTLVIASSFAGGYMRQFIGRELMKGLLIILIIVLFQIDCFSNNSPFLFCRGSKQADGWHFSDPDDHFRALELLENKKFTNHSQTSENSGSNCSHNNNQRDLGDVALYVSMRQEFIDSVFSRIIQSVEQNNQIMNQFVNCLENNKSSKECSELIGAVKKSSQKAIVVLRKELALSALSEYESPRDIERINHSFNGDLKNFSGQRELLSESELRDVKSIRQDEISLIDLDWRDYQKEMTKNSNDEMIKGHLANLKGPHYESVLKEVQNAHYLKYLEILTAMPILTAVSEEDIRNGFQSKAVTENIKKMLKHSDEYAADLKEASSKLLKEFDGSKESIGKTIANKLSPGFLELLFSHPLIVENALMENPQLCASAESLYMESQMRNSISNLAESGLYIAGPWALGKVTGGLLKKAPTVAKSVSAVANGALYASLVYPSWKRYNELTRRLNHLGEDLGNEKFNGTGFTTQAEIVDAKRALIGAPIEIYAWMKLTPILMDMFKWKPKLRTPLTDKVRSELH